MKKPAQWPTFSRTWFLGFNPRLARILCLGFNFVMAQRILYHRQIDLSSKVKECCTGILNLAIAYCL